MQDIHWAALDGDFGLVATLLRLTPSKLEVQDAYSGGTPLHWAARSGRARAVRYLISRGAEVDAEDRSGRTPLYWAILEGGDDKFSAARALLAAGADPNDRSGVGELPLLSWVVQMPSDAAPKAVRLLREAGVDTNAKDRGRPGELTGPESASPLHYAMYASPERVMQIVFALTDSGYPNSPAPDPWAQDIRQNTALHWAAGNVFFGDRSYWKLRAGLAIGNRLVAKPLFDDWMSVKNDRGEEASIWAPELKKVNENGFWHWHEVWDANQEPGP